MVGQLLEYLALLRKWNQVYNLTAVRDPELMLSHHLYDCMAIIPPMRDKLKDLVPSAGPGQIPVLDVGSGAGLPGVVMAICEPRLHVHCIDAVGKKTAFLRQVIAQLRLKNVQVVHGRVEVLKLQRPELAFQLITARAFASLAQLAEMTVSVMAERGIWMAMKARDPQAEIDSLPATIDVFHVEQLDVPALAAERCLVWMRQGS